FAAEANGSRIAAVLAANAELEIGPGGAAALDGDLDHLADPGRIERDKRVMLEDAELLIGADKARRIVARDAVDRLRQIVGAKAEERGALGNLAGEQSGARQFDHRAHRVWNL